MALTIIYKLILAIIFGDKITLMAFLPIVVGAAIGISFRFLIKPMGWSSASKAILLVATLLLGIIVVSSLDLAGMANRENAMARPDRDKYKVLLSSDFTGEQAGAKILVIKI